MLQTKDTSENILNQPYDKKLSAKSNVAGIQALLRKNKDNRKYAVKAATKHLQHETEFNNEHAALIEQLDQARDKEDLGYKTANPFRNVDTFEVSHGTTPEPRYCPTNNSRRTIPLLFEIV